MGEDFVHVTFSTASLSLMQVMWVSGDGREEFEFFITRDELAGTSTYPGHVFRVLSNRDRRELQKLWLEYTVSNESRQQVVVGELQHCSADDQHRQHSGKGTKQSEHSPMDGGSR